MFLASLRKTTDYGWGLYSLPKYKLRALGFTLHAAFHMRTYREWFETLESFPDIFRSRDRLQLVRAPARQYLRRRFSIGDRIQIIEAHYKLLQDRLSARGCQHLCRTGGLPLAELTGRSGRRYTITLSAESTKEGEITLAFLNASTGQMLARMRGSFGPAAAGNLVFWIGGLMGAQPPLGREDIRAATRDLNGLRPKHALMHALAVLCAWADVDVIHAPSAQDHIAHRWWRTLFTDRKIRADYDGFWQEFTSHRTPERDFRIELPLARRCADEVQARRRGEWKKRYARVAALGEGCLTALRNAPGDLS